MQMKKLILSFAAVMMAAGMTAFAAPSAWTVTSPDGKLSVRVASGQKLTYSVAYAGKKLINDSEISVKFTDGTVYGAGSKARKAKTVRVSETIKPVVLDKAVLDNTYNELTVDFKTFTLKFRAYDEGVAWRFVPGNTDVAYVESEQVEFSFPGDWKTWIPYVRDFDDKGFKSQFHNSFENYYTVTTLSGWDSKRLAFLPLLVQSPEGVNVCITESDLLNYPGLYLNGQGGNTLKGVMAPAPRSEKQGGHNMLEGFVETAEDYIAKIGAGEALPWRVVMVAPEDRQLADIDLVYKLAAAPDNRDWSWVKPGKVAWDWWNDWNLYGVDFKSGINNDTYKYYIDFASEHGIEYVILDEGWAVNRAADLFQIVPEIDMKGLCAYAESKNVGLILWAGYWAFNRDIEGVCRHYSQMGIKGFKVDFMNRDDQAMVAFYTKSAEIAAKYHLILDFHGAFKPAGLMRTWPNVINCEGVNGLEQMKWGTGDQVTYDVTIPFIRYAAGPADYTQGAMRNATRRNYKPVNSEPMSPGTRCHQLAEYMIFDAPLTMLCDSPSNYIQEKECTDFIAAVPTVWNKTVALEGKVGEYVVIAHQAADGSWWLGALNGWDARDITLDLSFLENRLYNFEAFQDGVNAHRAARDYKKVTGSVPGSRKVTVHLAPGGGYAAHYTLH